MTTKEIKWVSSTKKKNNKISFVEKWRNTNYKGAITKNFVQKWKCQTNKGDSHNTERKAINDESTGTNNKNNYQKRLRMHAYTDSKMS